MDRKVGSAKAEKTSRSADSDATGTFGDGDGAGLPARIRLPRWGGCDADASEYRKLGEERRNLKDARLAAGAQAETED